MCPSSVLPDCRQTGEVDSGAHTVRTLRTYRFSSVNVQKKPSRFHNDTSFPSGERYKSDPSWDTTALNVSSSRTQVLEMVVIPVLALLLALVTPNLAATLPKYITVCKRNDPKLNECFLASALKAFPNIINGDKTLKIPTLDPFRIETMTIGQGAKSNVGLELTFRDIDLIGLKDTVIEDARINLDNPSLEFELTVPSLKVKGPYEVNGNILVLPIKGKGQSDITLENVKAKWVLTGKLVGKTPSTQRLQVSKAEVDIDPQNMKINLEGLFGGDKTLSDNMNVFLNENWRDVLGELKPGVNEALAQILSLIGNQVVSSVPYDQLLPPK